MPPRYGERFVKLSLPFCTPCQSLAPRGGAGAPEGLGYAGCSLMITRPFLGLLSAADPRRRVAAIGPLVRAFLAPDLNEVCRDEIGAGLVGILDDPNPIVRRALAEAVADEARSPHHLILALACDQIAVSAPVLRRSPVLRDRDLVELVGEGEAATQTLIAGRARLSAPVAAALIEVGDVEPCVTLLRNPGARIPAEGFVRLAERHAMQPAVRAQMLARADLPAHIRQGLTSALCDALGDLGMVKALLPPKRARRLLREAWERVSVELAASCAPRERRALIGHLDATGRLSAGLILRALVNGNLAFLEDSLAFLSGLPAERAAQLVRDRQGPGFRALYERAGLPPKLFSGFRIAVGTVCDALARGVDLTLPGSRKKTIEAIIAAFGGVNGRDLDPLAGLMSRLADEAGREEARAVYWQDAAAA